ncbi:MAG: DNA repair protein RadC [Deltaproteobacteria bacterium]|nr:DNA repair protein RadC [Deltaproteobacteria bacterium]
MAKRIIKNIGPVGHRNRLRERFRISGRKALADYELIELLLTYAIPRVDTKPTAKALLKEFKTIFNVIQQPVEQLQKIKGIGPEAATYIRLIHACLTRAMEKTLEYRKTVSGPEDIFAYVRMNLGANSTECLYALYLDDARHIIHHQDVAMGTIDRLQLYPRDILKPALIHNATGLILVHNHPDGQPVPSENDLELTMKIEDLAKTFDIKLMDHLVVTKFNAYSIKTGKLL